MPNPDVRSSQATELAESASPRPATGGQTIADQEPCVFADRPRASPHVHCVIIARPTLPAPYRLVSRPLRATVWPTKTIDPVRLDRVDLVELSVVGRWLSFAPHALGIEACGVWRVAYGVAAR